MPQAVFADTHAMHIGNHKGVLSNPDARSDPRIVEAVLAHMQQHIELAKTTDPDVLALTGNAPLPSMQAQPQGGPQMQGGGGSPAEVMATDQAPDIEQPAPAKPPAETDPMSQQSYEQLISESGGNP